MKLPAVFLLCLSSTLANAQPGTNRVPVEDLRVLMIAAIDSPTGEARGLLAGKDADSISEHFKASGPILVEVTTERRYQQPGCSRLKLTLSQEGLHLPGFAAPRRRSVDVGLNYCRDGNPPRSLS